MSTTPDQTPTTPNPPSGTPVELYPMADIRFVMMRIAELGVKVDRLIDDVSKQGTKIDDVRDKITFVRGVVWVLSGLMGLVVLGLGWYVTGHVKITLQ